MNEQSFCSIILMFSSYITILYSLHPTVFHSFDFISFIYAEFSIRGILQGFSIFHCSMVSEHVTAAKKEAEHDRWTLISFKWKLNVKVF